MSAANVKRAQRAAAATMWTSSRRMARIEVPARIAMHHDSSSCVHHARRAAGICRARAGSRLPGEDDPPDRAVSARRGHRHRRAVRRAEAGAGDERDDRRRQPHRRRRGDRRRRSRARGARRLHAAVRRWPVHDGRRRLEESRLRPREAVRPGGIDRDDAAGVRRQPRGARGLDARAHRAGEARARQAQLRLGGHRAASTIWRWSSSMRAPASTSCTCRTRASPRRRSTSSRARSRR